MEVSRKELILQAEPLFERMAQPIRRVLSDGQKSAGEVDAVAVSYTHLDVYKRQEPNPDGTHRIERAENVKDVAQYIARIDEMIQRKQKLFAEE